MIILGFLKENSLLYPDNITNSNKIFINETSTNATLIDHLIIEKLLNIEFLYLLLPCYFFLIVGMQRYLIVSTQPKDENMKQNLHASFYIKRWLNSIMCLTYCATFGFSELGNTKQIWTADHKFPSLLYLLAIFAWYLSRLVHQKEKEKNLPQELYTHRFFWIGSFICSCYKSTISIEVITF